MRGLFPVAGEKFVTLIFLPFILWKRCTYKSQKKKEYEYIYIYMINFVIKPLNVHKHDFHFVRLPKYLIM
jgi:hypothetical protein